MDDGYFQLASERLQRVHQRAAAKQFSGVFIREAHRIQDLSHLPIYLIYRHAMHDVSANDTSGIDKSYRFSSRFRYPRKISIRDHERTPQCIRWRHAVAVLTITTLFLTSTEALAASGQSDESNSYTAENIAGTNDGLEDHLPTFVNLNTQTPISEARNGAGTLLRVWRGDNNTNVAAPVWADWTGGRPFQLGTTATLVNPIVVPFGTDNWLVLHTGTDGGIYAAAVFGPTSDLNNANWGNTWVRIPGNQTTNMAVSATQFRTSGANSGAVLVMYRGSGDDARIFYTWFSPGPGWSSATTVGDGLGVSSPSVTYNPVTDEIWATVSGLDNAVWYTHQPVGGQGWPNWQTLDRLTQAPPQIAATSDGRLTISYVDTAGHPNYRTFDQNLNPITDWTLDTVTNWVTRNAVGLAVVGAQLYTMFLGLNNTSYWKRLR